MGHVNFLLELNKEMLKFEDWYFELHTDLALYMSSRPFEKFNGNLSSKEQISESKTNLVDEKKCDPVSNSIVLENEVCNQIYNCKCPESNKENLNCIKSCNNPQETCEDSSIQTENGESIKSADDFKTNKIGDLSKQSDSFVDKIKSADINQSDSDIKNCHQFTANYDKFVPSLSKDLVWNFLTCVGPILNKMKYFLVSSAFQ